MDFHPTIVGTRLKRLRVEANWDALELSQASGVHRNAISRIENGLVERPQAATLAKLERALARKLEHPVTLLVDVASESVVALAAALAFAALPEPQRERWLREAEAQTGLRRRGPGAETPGR